MIKVPPPSTVARYLALGALLIPLLAPGVAWAQDATSGSSEAEVVTAPVEVDGTVLFRVRGVSSMPAADRAARIRAAIVEIASDQTFDPDELRVVETAPANRIQARDRIVMMVVDADASLEQVARTDLANAHALRIQQTILDYRAARTTSAYTRHLANAGAATLVLGLLMLLVWWISRWMNSALTARLRARIHTVGIQSFEVVRAERIWDILQVTLVALRSVVLLAMVLLYLGFVIAQFPQTTGLSQNMAAFALGPLQTIGSGLVGSIPSLVFLAVLFFVFRLALRVIRLFFDAVGQGAVRLVRFQPEWAHPTYNLIRVAVVAFGLIIAYPYIPGSQSAAFQGVSLFLGIMFSLGSSSALSNVIAGYMLIYRRAFKIGDRIKIGDSFGEVIESRMQVTHLRTPKNEELIIPNSQILSSDVMNYSTISREQGLILYTEVGIGYETPWRQVEAMLIEAAGRTTGLGTDPRPFVLEKKLGDFAVTYELNVYTTNVPAMRALYAALHRNILDVFNEYGVQIMTPAYEGDPPEPKVVAQKDWYAAPAAKVAPSAAPDVAAQQSAV